jgi:hypothetical protein
MRLKKESISLDAIGFEMSGLLKELQASPVAEAVFTPAINDWNNSRSLQLIVKAIRPGQ